MKNKVLFLALCFATLTGYVANAQTFIVKAGFSMADMKEKGDGVIVPDYDMKPGFHAGVAADIPLSSYFSIEPALLYSNKGFKYKGNFLGSDIDVSTNLHYLDIPVNFKASTQMEGGIRIYAAAGPYMGIGMAGKGKVKITGQGTSQEVNEDVEWGSEDGYILRRLDFGATFGAGVEVKQIQIGLSYDLGLANISASQEDNSSTKNRVLKLSVGWMFGKK